jgi:hypothetical protein
MVPIGSVVDPLAAETRFAELLNSWIGCSYQSSSRFPVNLFPQRPDLIGRTSDGSGPIEPDCAMQALQPSITPVLQYSNTPVLQYSNTPILQPLTAPILAVVPQEKQDEGQTQ